MPNNIFTSLFLKLFTINNRWFGIRTWFPDKLKYQHAKSCMKMPFVCIFHPIKVWYVLLSIVLLLTTQVVIFDRESVTLNNQSCKCALKLHKIDLIATLISSLYCANICPIINSVQSLSCHRQSKMPNSLNLRNAITSAGEIA